MAGSDFLGRNRDRGTVDGLCDKRIDLPLADIAHEQVRDVGTTELNAIHGFGDAGSAACRTFEDVHQFRSATVLAFIQHWRRGLAVENGNKRLLTAPTSSSCSLHEIIQTERGL